MKTLKDSDIFKNPEHPIPDKFEDRKTVKIIIENEKGEIALVTNPIHQLFLLPGGGAETDDLKEESKREALEESNCEVEIVKEVAAIEEFRNRNAKHYYTTCFLAKFIRESSEDLRTDEEKENGLETKWFSKDEALKIMKAQVEKVEKGEIYFYNTAFNVVRDYWFVCGV